MARRKPRLNISCQCKIRGEHRGQLCKNTSNWAIPKNSSGYVYYCDECIGEESTYLEPLSEEEK